MQWDRSGLEAEGFQGFVPFSALPTAGAPLGAGVYVVYRDTDETPGQDPRLVEQAYIADFVRQYGKRPFANLTD